jgi:hypothetical protein
LTFPLPNGDVGDRGTLTGGDNPTLILVLIVIDGPGPGPGVDVDDDVVVNVVVVVVAGVDAVMVFFLDNAVFLLLAFVFGFRFLLPFFRRLLLHASNARFCSSSARCRRTIIPASMDATLYARTVRSNDPLHIHESIRSRALADVDDDGVILAADVTLAMLNDVTPLL